MMQLEDRFLVLKRADIDAGLNELEKRSLRALVARVQGWRMAKGKPQNRYVVINQDEPYFADVLKLMEAHEQGSEAQG